MKQNAGPGGNVNLILGGTGKTGSRVAARMRRLGHAVRPGSRRGAPPFDWEDEVTWRPALEDVSAAYISYFPDLALPRAADVVSSFTDLAVRQGVRRLVLLSGRGEEGAEAAEKAVSAAGVEWTVVRCSWFNQNFSESYLRDPIVSGEVVLPAKQVGEPFVDADDIADAAVAALTDARHSGEIYELTGPRLLTFAEAIQEISDATGRDIHYRAIPIEEYRDLALAEGVPADVVSLLVYLFDEVLDGRNAALADGVQRALGREPRDFAEFVRDAAAAGAWD